MAIIGVPLEDRLIFLIYHSSAVGQSCLMEGTGCIAGDKSATGCKKRPTGCCSMLFISS